MQLLVTRFDFLGIFYVLKPLLPVEPLIDPISRFTSLLIITRLHCSCQGIYALIPSSLFRNLIYGCFLFDKHMLFKLKILPAKEKKN